VDAVTAHEAHRLCLDQVVHVDGRIQRPGQLPHLGIRRAQPIDEEDVERHLRPRVLQRQRPCVGVWNESPIMVAWLAQGMRPTQHGSPNAPDTHSRAWLYDSRDMRIGYR